MNPALLALALTLASPQSAPQYTVTTMVASTPAPAPWPMWVDIHGALGRSPSAGVTWMTAPTKSTLFHLDATFTRGRDLTDTTTVSIPTCWRPTLLTVTGVELKDEWRVEGGWLMRLR